MKITTRVALAATALTAGVLIAACGSATPPHHPASRQSAKTAALANRLECQAYLDILYQQTGSNRAVFMTDVTEAIRNGNESAFPASCKALTYGEVMQLAGQAAQ